jgi:Domain of unknown function (DUF222)
VFENDGLVELNAAATLAATEANEHTLITAETRRLELAAHWADLHPGDAVPKSRFPGAEHPVQLGGEGTPTVAEFAPAELGCSVRMPYGSACRLIADGLDLRHRLRQVWAAVQAGQVPVYQARRIATATRHLTIEQAGWVDDQLAPSLGAVPWGRLETLLETKIIEADPVGAEQRAAAAAQERFVRLGRSNEHGLKLIIARATAGHAIWFKALIDRIADILGRQGDTDSVDIRRSKAIGIIAQPAQALRLLCEHQNDDLDGPAEPADTAHEPTEDDDDEAGFEEADQDPDPTDVPEPAPEHMDVSEQDAEPTDIPEQDAEPTDIPEQDAKPADSPDQVPTAGAVEEEQPTPDPAGEATHRSLHITPPPFDPVRARPRAIIYVHLSEEAVRAGGGVARVEEVGPILLNRLHALLGDECSIMVKPVIDLPAGHTPVDSYEIPARLREQLQLRYPADVFPYAAAVSRRIDQDHTIPYLSPDKGGPPGQTGIGNLGPHVRRNHRQKTFGQWQVRQPEAGTWLWRSPHGRIYLVNATGTHPLSDTEFAHKIWRAASPPEALTSWPTPG